VECCTNACTLNGDATSVFLDDAIAHGQSKSGALTDAFCVKNGS
jgi:hypothetical protein